MYYHYIASQTDGKTTEGDIEASSEAEALAYLGSRGLKPISLKITKEARVFARAGFLGQKITVDDKVFLTKYLALMLNVGTDLFKAIDILIDDFDKPAMKALLIEIRSRLEKGQPFYLTFSKYPRYFSPVFINLVKAGEASGNLVQVFEELSVSLQKEQELRRKIKAALTYPIILLGASALMLLFLISFALPKIANVFMTSSARPPVFSRVVFAIGLFLNNYIFYVLGLLVVLGFGLWYAATKSPAGKRIFYRFAAKLPLLKSVVKQIAFQRFAKTLSSLLKAGLSILDSLEITADTVGHEELKDGLIRVARDGIAKGLTIGEAFRRETIFPRVIVNLMAISERAGHIENVLETLSNFYESEIDSSIKVLISFVEPIMLLGIGLIIGAIALAIIVPIYQLVGQFS